MRVILYVKLVIFCITHNIGIQANVKPLYHVITQQKEVFPLKSKKECVWVALYVLLTVCCEYEYLPSISTLFAKIVSKDKQDLLKKTLTIYVFFTHCLYFIYLLNFLRIQSAL